MRLAVTDKEDIIILETFKNNPNSKITDIVKKASTLTGRSYSFIFERYYEKYKKVLKYILNINI